MDDQNKFRNSLRDALSHLYNTAHLECHPLVPLFFEGRTHAGVTRAQMLRGLLKDAIESLRPPRGQIVTAPERRSYLILYYRYVRCLSLLEIEDELGISRRQLYRELRKGIDALVQRLWDRRTVTAETPASPSPLFAGVTQGLRHELDHWQLERCACRVSSLLDDVHSMLQPLIDQLGICLTAELPTRLPSVFVDPTLTRQALLSLLRTLMQVEGEPKITLEAASDGESLLLVLSRKGATVDAAREGWRTADLLLSCQGGSLHSDSPTPSGDRLVATLPVAAQTRVLVVDDVEATRMLIERYLTPHGYQVFGTGSGAKAIGLALEQKPELIILDVMMPGADGWHVLRDLKADPATASIPVVVCSVLNEPDLARSLGADAFIKKPVDRLDLLDQLESFRC